MKPIDVWYYTYSLKMAKETGLADAFPGFFQNSEIKQQAVHAVLHLDLGEGKFKQFEFDQSGFHEWDEKNPCKRDEPIETHKITTTHWPYDSLRLFLAARYEMGEPKKYVLGKEDCWALIIYFSEQLGIKKEKLPGPIGKAGLGQGGRSVGASADKFLKDPDAVMKRITENPDKAGRHVGKFLLDAAQVAGDLGIGFGMKKRKQKKGGQAKQDVAGVSSSPAYQPGA